MSTVGHSARFVTHVHCSSCGKSVSGVDDELGLVVRAYVECPECIEAGQGDSGVVEALERLGRSGLTVSVCCGPAGRGGFAWSVQVLSRQGEEFDRPFAAESFEHAVEIAELEVKKRDW